MASPNTGSISDQEMTRRALGRAHVPPTNVIRQLSEYKDFKTTVHSKNHVANTCTWDFPDVKFRVAALMR